MTNINKSKMLGLTWKRDLKKNFRERRMGRVQEEEEEEEDQREEEEKDEKKEEEKDEKKEEDVEKQE